MTSIQPLKELFRKNRSYRRFDQAIPVALEDLRDMTDNVRLSASAANRQPLRFILSADAALNREIFPLLRWAAYLTDWDGPDEGERPSAYIVILGNRRESHFIDWDYGIAMQTLLLSAAEKGFGGCLIASVDKDALRNLLSVPPELEIAVVVALGKPRETVVIEPVRDNNIKYWRDEQNVHHVPKRDLEQLIFREYP